MKNLNKKLYSVIIACLLMLCFSVVAMATGSTDSSIESGTPTITESSSQEDPEQTPGDNEDNSKPDSEVPSQPSSEPASGTDTEVSSNAGVESVETGSSVPEVSSETKEQTEESSVIEASSKNTTSVQAKNESSSSKNTTSQKTYSNVGGVVVDEPDTSGWGDGDSSNGGAIEGTSSLEESSTQKRTNKNITNYTSLFWILIWIPVLLILASVGALVYVNRKAFLEEDNVRFDEAIESAPAKKKISATEKAKRKNNHKNRTNVYKPRD